MERDDCVKYYDSENDCFGVGKLSRVVRVGDLATFYFVTPSDWATGFTVVGLCVGDGSKDTVEKIPAPRDKPRYVLHAELELDQQSSHSVTFEFEDKKQALRAKRVLMRHPDVLRVSVTSTAEIY